MPRKLIDLTGKRFGRFVVIEQAGKDKRRNYKWLCKCDCGNKKIIRGFDLKNGNTKSCGCLHLEQVTTHGHHIKGRMSPSYQSWSHMLQRCTNPSNERYKDYGGRGITVYKRWEKFENFLKDMGKSPGKGYSIERIDNNKGYCKSNCKWATRKEQNRNKRNNSLITAFGKTQCIAAWAEEVGIRQKTLWMRVFEYGWLIERALMTPVRKRGGND